MTLAQIPFPDLMRASVTRNAAPGEKIIVDLFAGGGGASTGIEHALNRAVDEAVNHDAEAIEMHARNHPGTRHHTASVWERKPAEVARGRRVGLLWLSPDCTDFSRAKGGVPIRDRRIRSLAWIGCKWAREVSPDVIMLENVREFEEWGPLIHQPSRDGTGFMWQVSARPIAAKRGRRKGKKVKPIEVIGPKHDEHCGWWLRFWRAMRYKVKPLMIRDPKRKGETFRRFTGQLRRLGYTLEHRVLNAADYGVNTIRKRFFMIARHDGEAIVWPARTHGPKEKCGGKETKDCLRGNIKAGRGTVACDSPDQLRMFGGGEKAGGRQFDAGHGESRKGLRPDASLGDSLRRDCLQPYRTAAECIDFDRPCPSIFGRKKRLAPNTLKRTVKGLVRYLFECAAPFIIQVNHAGEEFRGQSIDEPMPTLTQKHGFAFVRPFVTRCAHGEDGRWGNGTHEITAPLPTLTASKDFALTTLTLAPFLTHRYGEAPGQEMRGQTVVEPLRTITPTNNSGVLITASLVEMANSKWSDGTRPLTLPIPTITATPKGGSWAMVAAYLTKLRGSAGWRPVDAPLDTVCAGAATFCLTTPFITILRNHCDAAPVTAPITTIAANGRHHNLAMPFAVKYYGCGTGQAIDEPLHTITTKDRFGLCVAFVSPLPTQIGNSVEVYRFLMEHKELIGNPPGVTFYHLPDGRGYVTVRIGGDEYLITDIGLRMLTPRELLRAQFTPELAADYILPKSNAAAVHKIGNSVPPLVVSALVRANCPDLIVPKKKRRSA